MPEAEGEIEYFFCEDYQEYYYVDPGTGEAVWWQDVPAPESQEKSNSPAAPEESMEATLPHTQRGKKSRAANEKQEEDSIYDFGPGGALAVNHLGAADAGDKMAAEPKDEKDTSMMASSDPGGWGWSEEDWVEEVDPATGSAYFANYAADGDGGAVRAVWELPAGTDPRRVWARHRDPYTHREYFWNRLTGETCHRR